MSFCHLIHPTVLLTSLLSLSSKPEVGPVDLVETFLLSGLLAPLEEGEIVAEAGRGGRLLAPSDRGGAVEAETGPVDLVKVTFVEAKSRPVDLIEIPLAEPERGPVDLIEVSLVESEIGAVDFVKVPFVETEA